MPSSRTAFSFRTRGRTSSLKDACSKSASQRSGVINGKSEPNSTLFRSWVFAYWTSCGGKYFGDQPERSIHTLSLCRQIEIASSCHGNDGCASTIWSDGKSAATSSRHIGFEYFSRRPPPPGTPVPIPLCPEWKSAGRPASAITS